MVTKELRIVGDKDTRLVTPEIELIMVRELVDKLKVPAIVRAEREERLVV